MNHDERLYSLKFNIKGVLAKYKQAKYNAPLMAKYFISFRGEFEPLVIEKKVCQYHIIMLGGQLMKIFINSWPILNYANIVLVITTIQGQ